MISNDCVSVNAPTVLYRVHLEDEIPAVGSGHRWVFAREGRKWAFVLCPFTANTVRVRIATWQGVKKEPQGTSKYIHDYLQDRLRSLGREPTSFERSALSL